MGTSAAQNSSGASVRRLGPPILILLLGLMAPAGAQAPPAVPALPDSARIATFNLSGSNCSCSLGFALFGDGNDVDNWIQVYVNGVAKLSSDPISGWVLTSVTGSLSTIPRPITNAVLTFNAAQTATVVITGNRRPRRLSQFSEARGVAARDLNQIITDEIAQLREIWDKSNRSIVGQPGDVFSALPPAASRVGGVLAFDSSGLPVIQPNIPAATIPVNSLTNSLLAPMAAETVKCNNTTGSANPTDCTTLLLANGIAAPPTALPGTQRPANLYNCTSDNVITTNVECLMANYSFGGAAMTGNRFASYSFIFNTAATNNSFGQYAATFGEAYTNVGDGGSGGSPKGSWFGANFACELDTGSGTGTQACWGAELDTIISSSAQAKYVVGLSVVGSNAAHAATMESAITVGGSNLGGFTHLGWNNVFTVTDLNGVSPVNSSTKLFTNYWTGGGTKAVGTGIDLTGFTFSGNAFQSSGFHVDNFGNILGTFIQSTAITVAQAGTCNAGLQGARAFVTDQGHSHCLSWRGDGRRCVQAEHRV